MDKGRARGSRRSARHGERGIELSRYRPGGSPHLDAFTSSEALGCRIFSRKFWNVSVHPPIAVRHGCRPRFFGRNNLCWVRCQLCWSWFKKALTDCGVITIRLDAHGMRHWDCPGFWAMQLRHNDATREFRMSEKPARRVDTRDGSATELSITTKMFFTKWERYARRSLQALRSRSPEGADTHSRATLNRRGRSPWPDEERRREIQVSVGFQAGRAFSFEVCREIINSLGRGSCNGMHASRERDSAIRT